MESPPKADRNLPSQAAESAMSIEGQNNRFHQKRESILPVCGRLNKP